MNLRKSIAFTAAIVTAVVCSAGTATRAGAMMSPPAKQPRRLPPNVVPVSYQLQIAPDLTAGTFTGKETIQVEVGAGGADSILLNSQQLDVSSPALTFQKANVPVRLKNLPEDTMVEIVPQGHLSAGQYNLSLDFSGKLNDKLVGFYRSTFKDKQGKEHVLAVTQFEPADARRMFPCFDEPSFKATFKVNVRARHGLSVVANGPLEHQTVNSDGTDTFEFAQTPRMSSYLVALVVGELEATPAVTVGGIPVRVWSVAGKQELGTYARDEGAKLLPVLTNYFGINYPWNKLDLIAIPDFEAGAMENPGAITFRETLLLIDPATASSHAKRSSTSVIAHEMAHQWFGDLVTMKWWDDLWLNEAFATWMATKAVDKLHPDWDEWKGYAGERVESMQTDSLKSTRAIHSDVTNPEQAHEMFDVITYSKGAAILRMLERYVSEPTFQKGVHDYLVKHSFNNATTTDLWDAVGHASGAPVTDIMHGWVHQPGYPLLTLSETGTTDEAVQHRFLAAGLDPANKQIWRVPVGLRTLSGAVPQNGQSQAQRKQLMNEAKATWAASSVEFANAGGVGYYRVKYPEKTYDYLTQHAQQQLDPSERLALLDDTWALIKTGDLSLDKYLNLLVALRTDKDELVAGEIIDQLAYLDRFVDPAERPAFERFVKAQLTPLAEALGWHSKPGETQQIRMLRAHVLSELGTIAEDKSTIETAKQLFATLKNAKPGEVGAVEPDLLQPVTSIVAYNGGGPEFDVLLNKYKQAHTPEEEHRNLFALGDFRNADLEKRVMDMSIDGTVRTQDAAGLLGMLLSRRDTNKSAWDFVESHWQKINELYPEEMVPRLVSRAGSFNTQPEFDTVKSFLSTHHVHSGESTVARTLERIELNVKFRQHAAARFNEWLKQHYSG